MGRILQIQVRAWTYNEDDVPRAWPRLYALVWPGADAWSPVGGKRGVLELADALPDAAEFGGWPAPVRAALADGIRRVSALKKELEAALADWQPTRANEASDRLEDALAELERAVPAEQTSADSF